MAQEILNKLLYFKTTPKDITDWLIATNPSDPQWINLNKYCSREVFINYYLNYLREQFTSVLQNNGSKQTPAKKLLQSKVLKSDELILVNQDIPDITNNINNNEQNREITTQVKHECSIVIEPQIELQKKNIADPSESISEIIKPVDIASGQSSSPIISPEASTPVEKKKNIVKKKKRVELFSYSSASQHVINPAFKNSIEYERLGDLSDCRNISLDDNSFPSLGAKNYSSSMDSSYSPRNNKTDFSEMSYMNCTPKSKSKSNRILQSPVSPLYSNSVSLLSPINTKSSQNIQNQSGSYQQNITSTPKKSPNYTSKNAKTTPRNNFSLGDFIVTETKNGKKSSSKKNNSKIISKNTKQENEINQQNSLSSPTNTKPNAQRRKVNPTRINDTDEKGTNESTVFGNEPRPFTQNPQFVNVSPIDKSSDNESFQIERGLVMIERQKKIENTDSDIPNSEKPTTLKLLQKTPSKIMKQTSIINPNKALVENMESLDKLAELYSAFLDHNLVYNPMTELYFIINLITYQYKHDSRQSQNPISEKSEPYSEKLKDNCKYDKKDLSTLKKSLNFDNLQEEKSSATNSNLNLQYDKPDNLGCLNLIDDTKENFNLINEKLKGMLTDDFSCNNKKIEDEYEKKSEGSNVIKECYKVYLNTPHNCVYFSTKVLCYQKNFLKCLDRVTLKLLSKNNQISLFQPELSDYLEKIYAVKVSESDKMKPLSIGVADLNVCFQIDTDNREKFPSSIAFQFFRKQRDLFYEILKIYEDKHSVPGWTFQVALSGKIKTLLMMHMDVTNFTHFARLFKSQMLISCIKSGQEEDALDDEMMSFLKNVKDINPEKLSKLQRKLVTPLSQMGPVPPPSFPGIQEFYKDFILYAANPMFYTYLENTFVHEIMELNNSQFIASDIEETETEVDESTKQNFVMCLFSLRLLSKFLGFLTSIPYRTETSMLEDVIASQVTLRSKCLPHIDLQYCLRLAVIEGKLSLTVPWVVEYLAMMDHASLRLPYYKKILEMLYCIYRASNYHTIMDSDIFMSQKAATLFKFLIGWLFELPIFPSEFYFDWQSKYYDTALKNISEKHVVTDLDKSVVSIKQFVFLDKLEVIDDRLLYTCCPFLRELNVLLTCGNSNVNNSITYRHVTPVTSQLQKPAKKASTKDLEVQLEEAFFHGKPSSIKKTVEYVSERVASSCVKYICSNLLTEERQRNINELKQLIKQNYTGALEKIPESAKNALMKDMSLLSSEALRKIQEKVNQVLLKMCESRITQSIESLLADDCLKPVKDMCVKIAVRMAMERVNQWVQSRASSIFIKDMELELGRTSKINEEYVNKKCHNPNAASPINMLNYMRNIIWDLLENRGKNVTIDIVLKLWDQLYQCLTERSDLKSVPEKTISSLSVDLCLFLMAYRDDVFTDNVQEKIFKVWKLDYLNLSDLDSPLSKILTPRNITLMTQAYNPTVWLNCGKLLKKLLKKDILSIDALSDQAIALFRNDWPINILNNLSICLKEAIDDYRSSDEEIERIRYLLRWVAGAYSDMGCDGFNFSFG